MNEDEFKQKLTPEQYHVLRESGTEVPFSGKFLDYDKAGTYVCAACGAELFKSDTKYESNVPGLAGWPSFADVIDAGAVELRNDDKLGVRRVEVVCRSCGSHLGHLFDDDSSPTGQHYCINSVCLDFMPKPTSTTNDKSA